MRRVMNVAEKPSAAKQITSILSRGSHRTVISKSKYNPIYEFNYRFNGQDVLMSFTSVAGHVVGLEFEEKYSKKYWNSNPHEDFFKVARVVTKVDEDKQPLVHNLQNLSKNSSTIILWLDCDREGEAIAFEVLRICQEVNPRIEYHRAFFSAFTERDIIEAMRTLRPPDINLADAVESRQEIDLRLGAAFTRYQTTLLKKKIPDLANVKVISYGPCQFPTLGFVVEKWRKVINFVAEPFWEICVQHEKFNPEEGKNTQVDFIWDRQRLFHQPSARVLYEKCLENPEAIVISANGNPKPKYRPFPLSTVNMQKLGTSKLRMDSHRVMDVAEKLYNKGFISYPRTETDFFTRTINVEGLVNIHKQHPVWGQYAYDLIDGGKFMWPKAGKNDDKAHPPIHPVKLATQDNHGLTLDEWRVYELVTRHFLACCSKDAVGYETVVKIEIQKEKFHATGLIIRERNYLDIYPYDKWNSKTLPVYNPGERFRPKKLWLNQSETVRPNPITENELITEMDKNGIGTDATIHEHIKTILDRSYVEKTGMYFKPTKLGSALVDAYEEAGTNLWRPFLRAIMETNMTEISKGKLRKQEFLDGCLDEMEGIFRKLKGNEGVLLQVMKKYFDGTNTEPGRDNDNHELANLDLTLFQPINDEEGMCGNCGNKSLRILEGPNGMRVAACSNDNFIGKLPKKNEMNFKDFICPICSFQVLELKNDKGGKYHICPLCWSNPSHALFPDVEEGANIGFVPCFKCPKEDCTLASGAAGSEKPIMVCQKCRNNPIIAKKNKEDKFFLACKGFPQCRATINVPNLITEIHILPNDCPKCQPGTKKVRLKFRQEGLPGTLQMRVVENDLEFCFGGCDTDLELIGYNFSHRETYSKSTPDNSNSNSRSGFSTQSEASNGAGLNNVASYLDRHKQSQFQGGTQRPNNNNNNFGGQGNTSQSPSTKASDMCSNCKVFGHTANRCPKKQSPQGFMSMSGMSMNTNSNTSRSNTNNFDRPGLAQPSWDGSRTISDVTNAKCMKCKQPGHYTNQCPGFPKMGNFSGGMNNNNTFGGNRNNDNSMNIENLQPNSTTTNNRGGGGGGGGFACYICQDPGHMAPNCPNKGQSRAGGGGGGGGGGGYNNQGNRANTNSMIFDEDGDAPISNVNKPGTCFTCHEPGHFSTNCPKKGQGGGGGGGYNQGGYNQGGRSNFGNDNSNGGYQKKVPGTCYNCNEPGHYSTNCPKKAEGGGGGGGFQRNTGAGEGGGGGNSNYKCFKCGEQGHFAGSCPNPGNGGNYNNNNNNFGQNKGKGKRGGGNAGGGGEQKTCNFCGCVGRHPRGSSCAGIKKKAVKKNNGGQQDDYGGYE